MGIAPVFLQIQWETEGVVGGWAQRAALFTGDVTFDDTEQRRLILMAGYS
jgi:hypothetical protein